jgi:hypothetical protein
VIASIPAHESARTEPFSRIDNSDDDDAGILNPFLIDHCAVPYALCVEAFAVEVVRIWRLMRQRQSLQSSYLYFLVGVRRSDSGVCRIKVTNGRSPIC